jgi:hypothetical protein
VEDGKDLTMRMITRAVVALTFILMAGAIATTSIPQGIFFQAPGFDVRIGARTEPRSREARA